MNPKQNNSKLALISWAFYDFASSAYPAIIQTFIFAPFFVEHVSPDKTLGTVQWGFTMSFAGFIVALLGPLFGAVADQTGRKKRWVVFFTIITVLTSLLLYFAKPNASYISFSLILIAIGTMASEFAFIFYNAMLPDLAKPSHIGRWSGWGWSLGYFGGLSSLIASYLLFLKDLPATSFQETEFQSIRQTFPLSAFWYFCFSLPLFLFVKDYPERKVKFTRALKDGLVQLKSTFNQVRKYKQLVLFLAAHLLYIDGLTTVFAFGGVYLVGTFGIRESHVVLLGIAMHISSGMGAFLFAWIDDWIGPKKLILISISGLALSTGILLLISTEVWVWTFAIILGVFVGPVQAASRSYMAREAPKHLQNEMFGFFAFSGKATAFMGPFLVSWITFLTQNARLGLSIVLLFFISGGLLMLRVRPQLREQA